MTSAQNQPKKFSADLAASERGTPAIFETEGAKERFENFLAVNGQRMDTVSAKDMEKVIQSASPKQLYELLGVIEERLGGLGQKMKRISDLLKDDPGNFIFQVELIDLKEQVKFSFDRDAKIRDELRKRGTNN